MRKVFLDELPRNKRGNIDWINSVGYKLKFEYDGICGEFEIISHNIKTRQLDIMYQNDIFKTTADSLNVCKILYILEKQHVEYKYKIGDIIKTEKGKIKIMDLTRIKKDGYMTRAYVYQCMICDHIDEKMESNMTQKQPCSVCSNHKIKIGYNDIWTTMPDIANLLYNKEDGYKYFKGSGCCVDWICPTCNEIIKDKKITYIVTSGLSCPRCNDGVSYPEKFMYNVLSQLNTNFQYQYKFNKAQNRRYDFYLVETNSIIEVHGRQHYKPSFNVPLINTQNNDSEKLTLAQNNNVDNYIIIDAQESNLDYMKNSIINSQLNLLYDLSSINWEECHSNACKTLIKTVCEIWNSGVNSSKKISEIVHLHSYTVSRYLTLGAKIGWCNYSAEQMRTNAKMAIQTQTIRQVICLTTNKTFESMKFAAKYYNLKSASGISGCCLKKYKHAGKHPETGEKLKWMYIEDYNKMLEDSNESTIQTNN